MQDCFYWPNSDKNEHLIFVFYYEYFLINVKHIILGCALCFMTFTVLQVDFVAFMQDSCSDFGEYVMNIIYYC